MKKIISVVILLSIMSCFTAAHARSIEENDPGFVILDVLLYRPLGVVATLVGTAVFIGLTPLTALASIPEPHDAFEKTSAILILGPGTYTFVRPLGNRDCPYYMSSDRHKTQAGDSSNDNNTSVTLLPPAQVTPTPIAPAAKPRYAPNL